MHVDLHADRNFNDLRCFSGHLLLQKFSAKMLNRIEGKSTEEIPQAANWVEAVKREARHLLCERAMISSAHNLRAKAASRSAERYRLAEKIVHAEKAGLDSAWIAQHHFHESEGGLPAPFAFWVSSQRTSRFRFGTGIVTLPLENPIRVADDAAVLDLMSNGRFELASGPAETRRPATGRD